MRQKVHFDRNLLKKAVKHAMNDLKEKYAGILLSAHAIKIQSYAPDLARTIAGLILSSNDTKFQGECISLLGLQPQDLGKEKVEDCIKGKIIAVIRRNDRKPQRNREAAPFLFEDESNEVELLDEDEDDEEYDAVDISSIMSKKVTLKSSDRKAFEVEENVAFQSKTIEHLIKKTSVPMMASIPLPVVTANILGKVIEYCRKHVDDSNMKEDDAVAREDLKKWDAEFVKVDAATLLDLIEAAQNLDIKSLLELTSHALAEMVVKASYRNI
ncbi:Type 2 dna topoisomerase 6 subunit b-like [Thalictrum thalictroides]|uniref:Type 2 dna topoisomerase 6 subunit b-like n=1 Tax=Thalictrum thalictroides TaxID=46969 RepID=A0A7J6WRY6_THATH|nr:Type 2 dna topoisomerase 6 subunit b-like [Thalictrum thalictroides]